MTIKIGYPDHPRDYTALAVDSPDFVTNALAARRFEVARNLQKLGHPVDRTEWGMTAPTVNAYYRPDVNEIALPPVTTAVANPTRPTIRPRLR